MSELKQCPYEKAAKCAMDDPCEGCETKAAASIFTYSLKDKRGRTVHRTQGDGVPMHIEHEGKTYYLKETFKADRIAIYF